MRKELFGNRILGYMTLFYGVFAVLTAWVWVEYLKLIEVCKKDKMSFIYTTFSLGFLAYILFNASTSLFYKQFVFDYGDKVINELL